MYLGGWAELRGGGGGLKARLCHLTEQILVPVLTLNVLICAALPALLLIQQV